MTTRFNLFIAAPQQMNRWMSTSTEVAATRGLLQGVLLDCDRTAPSA